MAFFLLFSNSISSLTSVFLPFLLFLFSSLACLQSASSKVSRPPQSPWTRQLTRLATNPLPALPPLLLCLKTAFGIISSHLSPLSSYIPSSATLIALNIFATAAAQFSLYILGMSCIVGNSHKVQSHTSQWSIWFQPSLSSSIGP